MNSVLSHSSSPLIQPSPSSVNITCDYQTVLHARTEVEKSENALDVIEDCQQPPPPNAGSPSQDLPASVNTLLTSDTRVVNDGGESDIVDTNCNDFTFVSSGEVSCHELGDVESDNEDDTEVHDCYDSIE